MNRKLITLTGFLLLVVFTTTAQEKKKLLLNEAIDLSLKNSKQLKINLAKVEESDASLTEAKDRRLPDASVSGSYLRLNSANIVMKSSGNNGGSGGAQPDVSQLAYGALNLSLPIYTGGRIRYGIESAEFLKKATELDAANSQDAIVQNTIEAFANLFKAKTAVRLMNENLAQSKERLRELGNMEKNGLLARNDFLKAQLQSSNIELSLLDAQNNEQIATLNMNLLLGLDPKTELDLDTAGVERKNDSRSIDDYLNLALTSRKDKEALDYRRKAAETGIKLVKAEKLPALKLTGGYIAADIPGFFSVTNALNLGVGVNYNIGSLWKTNAKIKQADSKVKQLQLQESIADDQIQMEIKKNYLSLVSARKKIEVYERAVEQAKENYRIVKNKFDNTLATTTELLEADYAQLQATLSFTLARADAFVAYHKLLASTGTLTNEFIK